MRQPTSETEQAYTAACAAAEQSLAALPFDYARIGEERYARTWNLLQGYAGYRQERDAFLQLLPSADIYIEQMYHVMALQDYLAEYALRLTQATLEQENALYSSTATYLRHLPWLYLGLFLTAAVLMLLLIRVLSRAVVRPLLRLAQASRSIAEGDFSSPDLPVKSSDEVGRLTDTFNRMKHAMAQQLTTQQALHREEVRNLALEKDLEHTRLEVLKSQVNPHFLFNTLNMISCMARLEAARKIRETDKNCAILFLTGFDKFDYARQAISVRALDYLLKPYNEQELVFAVEDAIRQVSVQLPARQAQPPAPAQPVRREEDEDMRIAIIRAEISRFIDAHYGEDISMQDAAAALRYSDAYFCKLFKQCFKVNFSVYLNEYRVNKARQLILDPRLSLKDIGAAVGYSDANYFTRVFKRLTGQIPSEYRVAAAEKAVQGYADNQPAGYPTTQGAQYFADLVQQKTGGKVVIQVKANGEYGPEQQGKTIRVQDSQIVIGMIRLLGAVPETTAYSDVYSALETGQVDAAENNWPACYSMEHYKVARHYMTDEHSRVPEVQLVSGRTWDALPEEYRQTLQARARASAQHERQLWAQEETAARKAAIAGGCFELPLPEEEMQNFRQLVQPLYRKYCADYLPLVEEIQAE